MASRVKNKAFDAKETVQVKAEVAKQQVYEGTEAPQTISGKMASQAKGLTQQAREALLGQLDRSPDHLQRCVEGGEAAGSPLLAHCRG